VKLNQIVKIPCARCSKRSQKHKAMGEDVLRVIGLMNLFRIHLQVSCWDHFLADI